MHKIIALSSLICLFFSNCKNWEQTTDSPEYLHRSLDKLTATIKHDIFPPMIAARIYAYAHIAAYEALVPSDKGFRSLAGQLHGLEAMPKVDTTKGKICYSAAMVRAYLKVGKKLVFSEDSITLFEQKLLAEMTQKGVPNDVMKRSLAYGDTIAGAILAWAKKDKYGALRSATKYMVDARNPKRWRPTAPDYADALEPHWNEIRTLVMDSASQFRPIPPPAFDTLPKSEFYKYAQEVAKVVRDSNSQTLTTARYWDDNPIATTNAGHISYSSKKVTPGGHWLHISQGVCRQTQFNALISAEIYAKISIGLFEGFISCWDEKYRSEVIRPESYITKYIDKEWLPTIVTPPFPEYTSGHSVVSNVSATILSHICGYNYHFTDSTEVQFGMPARTYPSFEKAAEEAAISRLYAGIHYRPAIEEGAKQGKKIGSWLITKLKTRNI